MGRPGRYGITEELNEGLKLQNFYRDLGPGFLREIFDTCQVSMFQQMV